jgi:hypothetical protein
MTGARPVFDLPIVQLLSGFVQSTTVVFFLLGDCG